MSIDSRVTRALHSRADQDDVRATATPLYLTSAFGAGSRYFYTRKNNPNVEEFERSVAALEGAQFAVACSTGMAAIAFCIDLVAPGDAVVVNQDVYGCTYRALNRYAVQRGLQLV